MKYLTHLMILVLNWILICSVAPRKTRFFTRNIWNQLFLFGYLKVLNNSMTQLVSKQVWSMDRIHMDLKPLVTLNVAFLTNRLELQTQKEVINDLMMPSWATVVCPLRSSPRVTHLQKVWLRCEIFSCSFLPSLALRAQRCLLLFASHLSKLGAIKTGFTWHPTRFKSVMFDND